MKLPKYFEKVQKCGDDLDKKAMVNLVPIARI